MQRDKFRIKATKIEWIATGGQPEQPVLYLHFNGSRDRLQRKLIGQPRDKTDTGAIDVSFRFISADGETDAGVLGLTDSVTGDYILECEVTADPIEDVVQAAHEYEERTGKEARYKVLIQANTGTITNFDTKVLLVYDVNGTLLRDNSIISGGIEI